MNCLFGTFINYFLISPNCYCCILLSITGYNIVNISIFTFIFYVSFSEMILLFFLKTEKSTCTSVPAQTER